MNDGPRRIIYPGTFDPITYGHIDVVGRAVQLFDEVVLAIAADSTKKPLFALEERLALAEKALVHFGAKVRVTAFRGLLIDYVQSENSRAILRGLRAVSDFEFEFQMALMNRKLNDSIETLFLMPRGEMCIRDRIGCVPWSSGAPTANRSNICSAAQLSPGTAWRSRPTS